jgi:hypothetical protein
MYQASIPVFLRAPGNLSAILGQDGLSRQLVNGA